MARIVNPILAIAVDNQGKTATCVVTCTATFSETEVEDMAQGARYSLDCTLWDRDTGDWFDTQDDQLYSYETKFFPDSTPSRSEAVRFQAAIALDLLNEDKLGPEAIYGRLKLAYVRPRTVVVRTNEVRQEFGN